jgi:DnaJ-class molecular chaperone
MSNEYAQRQYDNQMPPSDETPLKTCPTCNGEGEVEDGNGWQSCPQCNGDREIPMTSEDFQDIEDAKADKAYEDYKDRMLFPE